MDRRDFLRTAGAAAASTGLITGLARCAPTSSSPAGWEGVRREFQVDGEWIHLAGLLLAPHPRPVRETVERHRAALDRNPAEYVEENDGALKRRSREGAAGHMGVRVDDVALTDSTTMGIGLVYGGLRVSAGQELLTTDQDYPATHHALRFREERAGVQMVRIDLGDLVDPDASADALVDRILGGVTDRTRALAMTWVHSSSGLKLPVPRIAERLEEHNVGRGPADRALLCLDGVHGLGVEDMDLPDLGCDFFFAGTHKWVFAPRGTGILWGRPETQDQLRPTIPTFIRDGTWGGEMSPGGFKAFEHQWSMAEAFEFLEEAGGRSAVEERIHEMATHLKEELRRIEGVRLRTPIDRDLSSGIVCFDVEGMEPDKVVAALGERRIIGSVTPYAHPHARLTPGLLNDHAEIDRTLEAVRDLAGGGASVAMRPPSSAR